MADIHTVDVKWDDAMSFSTDLDGHRLVIDAAPEVGGRDLGPRPKQLMLVALAGCTGMDVVSILKKMRVEIDGLDVKVSGELTEDHPRYYRKIHVVYEFRGTDLPMDKLEKAVDLSENRYCGVGAVYRMAVEVTSEIRIV